MRVGSSAGVILGLLGVALLSVTPVRATSPFSGAPPTTRPAPPVVNTELDELAKVAKAPARFADHDAKFGVEKQVVEFRGPKGTEAGTMWVIKDGGRCVAVYSDRPQIDLITSDPAKAPVKIDWPVRYHNATYLNTRITTIAYVDKWGVSGDTAFIGSDGWSPVISRTADARYHLATCNVWQDQHNHVAMGDKPDKDGLFRTPYRYRLAIMPPEVTKAALDRTKIDDFGGRRAVMLRFGRLEDFEDQPLPLTVTDRAGYSTSFGPKSAISMEEAHSGKRSMVMNGVAKEHARSGYNGFIFTPQFNLKAKTTYRIECWVKVVGADTEAFIAGDLYEYTPHTPKRIKAQQSNTAKTGSEWQKLELTFTTPEWDPFVDLRLLVAGGGKAYFDDFQFAPVDAVPALRDATPAGNAKP